MSPLLQRQRNARKQKSGVGACASLRVLHEPQNESKTKPPSEYAEGSAAQKLQEADRQVIPYYFFTLQEWCRRSRRCARERAGAAWELQEAGMSSNNESES